MSEIEQTIQEEIDLGGDARSVVSALVSAGYEIGARFIDPKPMLNVVLGERMAGSPDDGWHSSWVYDPRTREQYDRDLQGRKDHTVTIVTEQTVRDIAATIDFDSAQILSLTNKQLKELARWAVQELAAEKERRVLESQGMATDTPWEDPEPWVYAEGRYDEHRSAHNDGFYARPRPRTREQYLADIKEAEELIEFLDAVIESQGSETR